MVNVFPAPVDPYAKTLQLKPRQCQEVPGQKQVVEAPKDQAITSSNIGYKHVQTAKPAMAIENFT